MTIDAAGRNAIILAAGAGSRLVGTEPVKPLADVGGKPLILRSIESLTAGGVTRAVVVLGNAAEQIAPVLGASPIPVDIVRNAAWQTQPNGVSLLAARDFVRPGTLLTMADHLLSSVLVRQLVEQAASPVALAVDRRLGHPWVDEADVTRVRTEGNRIVAIGKSLCVYDCHDTGLFQIGPELTATLAELDSPGISDGVRRLASKGLATVVDIGDAPWLDVDDARALAIARREWRF